jgi:hypothetical protein
VSARGCIDLDNEFFQDLVSSGRRCVSCHVSTSGWRINPRQLQETFAADGGAFDDGLELGVVSRTNDRSNSPKADVSTKAELLNKALIWIRLPIPSIAQFETETRTPPGVPRERTRAR